MKLAPGPVEPLVVSQPDYHQLRTTALREPGCVSPEERTCKDWICVLSFGGLRTPACLAVFSLTHVRFAVAWSSMSFPSLQGLLLRHDAKSISLSLYPKR